MTATERATAVDERTRFDRFAEAASRFVSEAAFFTISALLVAVWVPTIWIFQASTPGNSCSTR